MDTGYAILEGTAHPGRDDGLLGLLNGRSCHATRRRLGPA